MTRERQITEEERMFTSWVKEAVVGGLVAEWVYQSPTFPLLPAQTLPVEKVLKTKTKIVQKHLCQDLTYTPDFTMRLTDTGVRVLSPILDKAAMTPSFKETSTVYIDTKGAFTVQHSQSQVFSAMQKLVYHFYGVWVERVVPWKPQTKKRQGCLLTDTWCPEELRWMKSRKVPTLNKMGETCVTMEQFLKENGI